MDRPPALPEYYPECTKAEDKVEAYSGSMEDNRKKKGNQVWIIHRQRMEEPKITIGLID